MHFTLKKEKEKERGAQNTHSGHWYRLSDMIATVGHSKHTLQTMFQ